MEDPHEPSYRHVRTAPKTQSCLMAIMCASKVVGEVVVRLGFDPRDSNDDQEGGDHLNHQGGRTLT